MKVSLQWLGEYVTLTEPPAKLADRLAMAGFEVEGIEQPGAALAGVVVAQILEAAKHPNADKLSVTRVDAGGASPLQIVCGAKNYKVGDKVPLATVGARLPNGVEIKLSSLRGVESAGMLCSEKELGLSEAADGLLILEHGLVVGTPIALALGLDDAVLDVSVTANRPDALAHVGIARELAVLTGQALRLPSAKIQESGGRADSRVRIRIEDPERCWRYAARVIEGVTVASSPEWLSRRLKACGVRAINNVVDVTNYVLLEYGQPLHAFDLDKLSGPEIVVRTARPNERLTTLDGKERVLAPDDLLICDRDRPHVLAGVMGGAASEVSAGTTRVLLECAAFQPATVRKSSRRHALHTESSHRFERGTDVDAVPLALARAAAMIAELGKGRALEGIVDAYPKPREARTVGLSTERVAKVLGTEVPGEEIRRILSALGFERTGESDGRTQYRVPLRRVDVEREEDLIEELARIRGYHTIPSALPKGAPSLAAEPVAALAERRVRQALAGCGFDEAVNFSFVAPAELSALGQSGWISLQNPLSVERSAMRTTLYASLLQNVSHSLRHQIHAVRLYELARVYLPDAAGGHGLRPVAREERRVGGALYGLREGRAWTAKGAPVDFYDVKAAVEAVLGAVHVADAAFEPILDSALYHPRAAATVRVGANALGALGELHPLVAKGLDLPAGIFLFELDFERLVAAGEVMPRYRGLARFPAVLRDIAVVVDGNLPHGDVQRLIVEVGAPLVCGAALFDVYTGPPIPEGKKNLAYALSYQALDRTLTDVEVNQAHEKIVAEVNRRLGGSLRGSIP